jgi:hypothetical protein
LAVSVQVTPALAGSFWTVALNWVLKKEEPRAPAASSVTLFWIVTAMATKAMPMEEDFDGCATDVAVTVTKRLEGSEAGAL